MTTRLENLALERIELLLDNVSTGIYRIHILDRGESEVLKSNPAWFINKTKEKVEKIDKLITEAKKWTKALAELEATDA